MTDGVLASLDAAGIIDQYGKCDFDKNCDPCITVFFWKDIEIDVTAFYKDFICVIGGRGNDTYNKFNYRDIFHRLW